MKEIHRPVLLERTIELLDPKPGEKYLDLTAGFAGHAAAVIELTEGGPATLVDRDPASVEFLRKNFESDNTEILHSDYESFCATSSSGYDLIMADLGVSSLQLDDSNRGFSFRDDGPLDMRMDNSYGQTAADIVNSMEQDALADLIYQLGEERQSRIIARAIVDNRPITSTAKLAGVISAAYRGHSRIHPATRTFQALRIAVNDELGQLERTLPRLLELLNPGGRLAIISFHSLEDRKVKWFIRESEYLEPLNKKVIQGKTEDVSNPRARSAKLRAAAKKVNPLSD